MDYLIAKVDSLIMVEGKEILKSERIKAKQKLNELEKELERLAEGNIIKKAIEVPDENAYTKEYRRKLYKELEEEKIKKEEEKNKPRDNPWNKVTDYDNKKLGVYRDDGEIRICNQGKYQFYIDENVKTGVVTFEIATPKHLTTTQIKVDLNVKYIRVEIKEKITQWRLENEIYTENAVIQRSQTSGHLLIKAFLISKGQFVDKGIDVKKLSSEVLLKENSTKLKEFIEKQTKQVLTEKYEKSGSSAKTKIYSSAGTNLRPIESLNIIDDMKKNVSSSSYPRKQLITYDNRTEVNDTSNKISDVKEIDSNLQPSTNVKLDMSEICKDVDLSEIPELD